MGTLAALQLFTAGFEDYPQYLCRPCDDTEVDLRIRGTYCSDTNVKQLLTYAIASPYGDIQSGTTLVDESVRKCKEIQQDVSCKIGDKALKDMIKHSLFPGHKQISITFNKIVIYEPGGHFSRHVDTPAPGVIGTLVIVPKTKHSGGNLVLETRDGNVAVTRGMWGAFFSSMPHCVEPVTEGYRVALTFYILSGEHPDDVFIKCRGDVEDGEGNEDNEGNEADGTEEDGTEDKGTATDVGLIGTLQRSISFGIILTEQYAISEMTPKGSDAVIIEKLREGLGCTVTLTHVLRSFNETYCYSDGATDDVCDGIYEFNEAIFTDIIAGNKQPHKRIAKGIRFYLLGKNGEETYTESQQFVEHTGNECQEGLLNNIYFHMPAIIS